MKALIGIKKGMTRVVKGDNIVPVTVLDVTGCILSKKEAMGFELGLGEKKKSTKALAGKYKEAKRIPLFRKYFKGDLGEEVKIGDEIKTESFTVGEKVTVTGISKGKGFEGVVKRWGFKGGQRTRGQSDRLRAPGSIGAGTDPGRVLKGKKMGGRMGQDTVTIKDKEIIDIKENYILISGPVPGPKGQVVSIFTE
ncbi:MAG: 50S ribosomal protein L3 [candidate division WS6 bacterium GW2011_GWF1_35_23]|uniref:50S ribosomal protein L3 n=1 Tax=candidate division WS6 bacterium GW2011_GWF1_35_23 TaxID=1619097 RepID=A0A0G0ESS1_9BACT|nr:MAG: 50S ribosomal protein L3 [candidate division WS6 bacterium GW2011_GWF1_35_23]